MHWFRSFLTGKKTSGDDPEDPDGNGSPSGTVEVKKISTDEQLADLFTKPLAREVFERLRVKLMGW